MKASTLSASLVAFSIIFTQHTQGLQMAQSPGSQYETSFQETSEELTRASTKTKRGLYVKQIGPENTHRCSDAPSWPRNSRVSCDPKRCTFTCIEGYTFPGGSAIATMVCENGFWIHTEAKWAILPDCRPVIQCSGGKVYMSCGPAYGQPGCDAATDIPKDDGPCVEGCYCPEGTLLHEDQCITKEKCPCILGGKTFAAGSKVPEYCNTCTCTGGRWICTDKFCGCRCSMIGDPHYITFDGKKFDFMGKCSYYLVKNDNFSIEAENVGWRSAVSQPTNRVSGPSWTKTVTINIHDQIITLKQKHGLVVNGEDIAKMPYSIAGVNITSASSLLMLVKLPNGVQVRWDGDTTAHIDVPVQLKDQTKGLCGTFNYNKKDDFLNPENAIENNAIPFGNKWKITEKCENLPDVIAPHPCDTNTQMKATAENYCSKIKSEIFKECHWHLNPDEYYEYCLYDMCSCDVKVSNCLCPIIAGYATECFRKAKVKLDWRNKVRECGMQCPGGQTYQVCGNSCTRTCNDIAVDPDCIQQCVEGCNCPVGQTLDDEGKCIPIGQCKCQHDGLEFPAGYKEERDAPSGYELCTCTNAVWRCKTASPEEIINVPRANDRKNMCNASANMEFTTCETYEPVTCKNMHSPEYFSASVCYPGCQCKEGYVLDTTSKNCLKPIECPCYHGGRSYQEDSIVQRGCNTCQCQNGKWKCTDKLCTAECSLWGNSHYKTFDGEHFDYQGRCDYVLAKGNIELDSFDVSIENVPCGSLGTACLNSVTVRVSSGKDTESVTFAKEKPVPKYKTYKHIVVREIGLFGTVEAPDLGFVVHWDKGTVVYVRVHPRWKSKIKGLCGNYNDNNADDFQIPPGGQAEVSVFGSSWALQAYCPESFEITDACKDSSDRMDWALKQCSILKSPLFAPCHIEVSLGHYYEKCLFDSCACDQGGDSECLCTALTAYAQECNNRGVPVKWRSQQLCPMQCDEWGSKYSPCMSTCPIDTCDNLAVNNKLSKICGQETCIEGCSPKPCPPDFIYSNSSYLHCVPKNVCKSFCLEDGVTYYEGDIMKEDDCHICYCSGERKICKNQPCTPATSDEFTTQQLEKQDECKPGWTNWINQDKLSPSATQNKKKEDKEPLPTQLLLNNSKESSRCDISQMVDIECRTVGTHIPAKRTGLAVECGLEKGLVCKSARRRKTCHDFEIRVLCQCD